MRLPIQIDGFSPYEEIEKSRRIRLVLGVCNVSIVFSIPLIIFVSVMLLPRINAAFAVAYGLCVGILPVSSPPASWPCAAAPSRPPTCTSCT